MDRNRVKTSDIIAEVNSLVYDTDAVKQMLDERERLLSLKCNNYNFPDFYYLASLVKEFPYNPNALEQFTFNCYDPVRPYDEDKLRLIYSEPERLGVTSGYGQVMTAKLDSTNVRPFIVKTAKKQSTAYTVVHEAFVGIYALNRLRRFLPNFTYVFGYAEGTKPIGEKTIYRWLTPRMGKDRDSGLTCDDNNPDSVCPYVFEERILNSQSIYEYKPDAATFLQAYVQVLLALNYAFSTFGFTHYDLHTNNVLLRKLDKKYYIPYPLSLTNSIVYVYSDVLPMIIDYGTAHIELDGQVYGPSYYIDDLHHNARNYAYPYHDAYKLLCFSLYNMYVYNKTEANKLTWLFRYFSDEQKIEEALAYQYSKLYSLPLRYNYVGLGLDDLIRHISAREPYLLLTFKPPNAATLSCDYLNCTKQNSNVSENTAILRLYYYYDLLNSGTDIRSFDLRQDITTALNVIKANVDQINRIDESNYDLPNVISQDIFNESEYTRISKIIDVINILADKVRMIFNIYNVANYLYQQQGYHEYKEAFTKIGEDVAELSSKFMTIQNNLDEFRRKIAFIAGQYRNKYPKYYAD